MASGHKHRSRKETIRDGLEIEFDVLDSDLLRCYIRAWCAWSDGPQPRLAWTEHIDRDGWVPGKALECRVMTRTLDDDAELTQGLRFLRLQRYTGYADLADLAARPNEPGEFVIRKPTDTISPVYISRLDEATLPTELADADAPDSEQPELGVYTSGDINEALRFSHAEAIRMTVRVMLALGYDLPGEHGDYWEPVRLDVAHELHARAVRRPRPAQALYDMLHDISREPQE